MRYAGLLLLLGLHGTAWPQTPSAEKVFETLAQSVWYVWGVDPDDRRHSQGSGVVVAPGKVITNCHVLEKVRFIFIQRENVLYGAKLEHADVSRDICQLEVKNLNAPAVPLGSSRTLKVGQKVYALGNPRGLEGTFSEGIVSALRGPDGKDAVIQTTAPLAPGSSGGGLFDADGRLVGITTAGAAQGNLNFAVPVEWVTEAGERIRAAEERRKQALVARTAGSPVALAPGMPAPGANWRYRLVDRAFGTREAVLSVTVSGVDGLIVREAVLVEGQPQAGQIHSTIAATEARFTERSLPDGMSLSEFAPYLLADQDLERGSWRTIPGVPAQGSQWQASGQAVGWETVSVPAGTFRALKVRIRGTREPEFTDPRLGNHEGAEFEYVAWYAEETRRVVKMQRQMRSRARVVVANETLELLKHDPR